MVKLARNQVFFNNFSRKIDIYLLKPLKNYKIIAKKGLSNGQLLAKIGVHDLYCECVD